MNFPRRHGTVLIVTLSVLVIISAFVLVFARTMRVEAIASANSLAAAQASAIERAGEQYALAQILGQTSGTPEDVFTMDDSTWTGLQVGDGYFWIIRPDYGDTSVSPYGLVDESAKISLNMDVPDVDLKAQQAIFTALPGMTDDLAQAIMNWKDTTGNSTDASYYMSLPSPYTEKQGPFETVEELLLVRGFTRQLLYGQNAVTPGVTQPTVLTDDQLARGIYDLLTVYSAQSETIPGNGPPKTQIVHGMVNFNRAPEDVLTALGFPASDVSAIVAARSSNTSSIDGSWLSSATLSTAGNTLKAQLFGWLPPQAKSEFRTYQYSAEVVAVSGNGRAFRRARVVIDIRNSTTPKIVYRRDLTDAGWPLAPEILDSLRHGNGLPAIANTSPVRRTM